jgi:hypothetical protein
MSSTTNTVSPSRTFNNKATMSKFNTLTDKQRTTALTKTQTQNPHFYDVSEDREIAALLQDASDLNLIVALPQGAYRTHIHLAARDVDGDATYCFLVSPNGKVTEGWEVPHSLEDWSDMDLKWCGLNRNGKIRATRTKRSKRTNRK